MNTKKLLIWVSALIVVIAIIIVNETLSNRKPSEKTLKFFPTATEKSIGAVFFMDAQDTIKLRKKGDIWVVEPAVYSGEKGNSKGILADNKDNSSSKEFTADSASIASMLEKLVSMKKGDIISENKEKQAIYEVDSSKGLFTEVFDLTGKSLGAFWIGKNTPDYNGNYVRPVFSNTVYSVSGSVKYSFFTDEKRWRNKTIVRFDKAQAKKITLNKKGTLISLSKAADTGSVWNLSEPVQLPAKSDQVDELLNTLSNFNAADFEDSVYVDSAMGFNDPEMVVTVTVGSTQKTVTIGKVKSNANKYWVRADGKNVTFLVYDYEIQKLDKNVDGLKADPILPTTTGSPLQSLSTGTKVEKK